MNDDLPSLFEYNVWANRRMLDAVRALSAEAYSREQGGGWPSVRASLVHLAGATDAWARRLAGEDVTRLPSEAEVPALAAAEALLVGADARLGALVPALSPERLASPFSWKNLRKEEKTAPLWAVLRHVVNHGSYHRGQIASLVKRAGGTPAATDLVFWAIERHAARGSR